jgi:hypothetical protein
MEFIPDFKVVSMVRGTASIGELAEEVAMFSATPKFMRENGGPIVAQLLDGVPDEWYAECDRLGLYPNGDVRIHRLYPGDFPAYPGWHCDGEYRETYFSQPDLNKVPLSRHVIATVSSVEGGVSNPQFLMDPVTLPVDMTRWGGDMRVTEQQHALWAQAHRYVENLPQTPRKFDTADGQLVEFGCRALHRVMPSKTRGWRLFFRLSMWHKPNLGEGQLVKQEQVYQVINNHGW